MIDFWYLASPYADYEAGHDLAASDAAKIAAWLMEHDVRVFSPIAHTHAIAKHINGVRDHDFWLSHDMPFLYAAKGLMIAPLNGWKASRGIRFEVEWFAKKFKVIPNLLIDPGAGEPKWNPIFPSDIKWEGLAYSQPISIDALH